jgi:tRNA nucleotidyltransferase/poly(A) polymerase
MTIAINMEMDPIRLAFDNAAVPVRLVGGCVRDILLGIEPKDWDMATPATPDQILDILKAANINAFDMSNGHGTITAIINSNPYEITTLRQDLETDGRHAVIGFVSLDHPCLNPELLRKFIDMGYSLDQDYTHEELMEALQRIDQ